MKFAHIPYRLALFNWAIVIIALTASGCSQTGMNPFASGEEKVSENIRNLMGLQPGMTKGQVFKLAGVANYIEGESWGSVWFYKYRAGTDEGTLANRDVEKKYMPVVFDSNDRVIGYGYEFYKNTIEQLGSGPF
jgi:outer membrane protein assembly factor BamE (lipoprotein component of BamABCDE complex)